ncbi:MAG TPA: M14 family zinc carboxypeptidase, partial [Acidobacteriota bacterium]|nr:M14 family zinc carboxypeptidase [Acidobacteriota bacterium]
MRPKLFLAVWLVLLAAGAAGAGETPPFAFDRYHEPEAIAARMRQLALTHPDVARVHELATSPGGRPLLVLEIGPETAAPAHRLPAVLVAANLEGSVPVASEAAQYLAQVLLDKPEARGDQGKHDQTRTRQPRAEAGQRRGHGKEWRRAADRNDNGACGAGADQGAVMHVNCLAPASGGPDSRHSCWRPRWHPG